MKRPGQSSTTRKHHSSSTLPRIHPNELMRRQQVIRPRILESSPVHETDEAVEYDAMIRRYAFLLNKPFIDLISTIGLTKGRILDIGTGPGWIPIGLAQKCPHLEIWALDASNDMLARGRSHAKEAGVNDRIHFMKGNAVDLPFETGYFDLVVSHFMLHHIDQPQLMFNEAARVTRGGGKIVIKDLIRQAKWKTKFLLWFSKHFLRYSPLQLQMYEESIDAALTMKEVKGALEISQLSMAKIHKFRGMDFIITS